MVDKSKCSFSGSQMRKIQTHTHERSQLKMKSMEAKVVYLLKSSSSQQ